MRNSTMPKTVHRWCDANPDKAQEVFVEYDEWGGFESPFSIWCYLSPGWINEEVHHIHEPTAKEFLEKAKYFVRKCECKECLELIRKAKH